MSKTIEGLIEGVLNFQSNVYPKYREEFQRLEKGQKPKVLFITCSDSRIDPCLITSSGPEDLFVCRNAGNIVPSYSDENGGVSAAIEFAVAALGVTDIVVCGHSDCGAMKGVLDPKKVEAVPRVASWLRNADSTATVLKTTCGHLSGDDLLNEAIRVNVIAQLANLRTHPSVMARLHKGDLRLHGWVYSIGTGEVEIYSEGTNRFVPVKELASASASASGRPH